METSYHIFYTDDDRDDQDMFKSVLEDINRNTHLHLHSSGDEVLTALKNPPPTPKVVFLDLNMPDKDGFEVLREIRADKQISDTPVVIFSTSNDDVSVNKAWSLHANMYVVKPVSYEQMSESIGQLLNIDWKTFTVSREDFVYTEDNKRKVI